MSVMESPMVGIVLEILVTEGQKVAEDDEVIILEAMKLENPIYAPEDGVIKEIKVKVGQQLEEGDIIAIFE